MTLAKVTLSHRFLLVADVALGLLWRMDMPLKMPPPAVVPNAPTPRAAVAVAVAGVSRRYLNSRELDFVTYYRADGNATQAAIRAGYSKRSAASQGSSMLKRPHIREEITRRAARTARRHEITIDTVAQEHGDIAFGNPDAWGTSLKWSDKRGSLDSLARHLGMFVDRTEHSGSVTFEDFRKQFTAIDVTPDAVDET